MSFWVLVDKVIKSSDVVLLILDARMPDLSRNYRIEDKIERSGKRAFYVFNKIDLVSQKELEKLRGANGEAYFVSGAKNSGLKKLKVDLIIMAKQLKKVLRVGIVGYPNVGKSSIINALAHRARASVSSKAGTTQGVQWVNVGEHIRLLDTPGVIPMQDREVELALIGAKNPEKLKNPERVALDIIRIAKDKGMVEGYNGESEEILIEFGKRRGFLLKGGVVDENRTAMHIIREWQRGRLKF